MPPLRDRRGDVMLLANHFLKIFSGQHNKQIKGFSVAAMELVLKYPFPGNVRELENAVERAVVMGKGDEVQPWDLPEEIHSDTLKAINEIENYENLSKAIKDFERQYIIKALDETKGNRSLAAKMLGVSRKTLWEKCKVLEIEKS